MTLEWNERLTQKPLVIGILGVIGAGKSTFASSINSRLRLSGIEENFTVNPYLSDFYDNPTEFSFKSQTWFLIEKVKQLKGMDSTKSYLLDPAIEMDRLYAETLAKIGFMNKDEYKTYSNLFDALKVQERLREPDLYLWVDARLPVVRERILKRGRPFEMKMLAEYPHYLSELRAGVRKFAHSQSTGKVLYVNATRDSFLSPANLDRISRKIKTTI